MQKNLCVVFQRAGEEEDGIQEEETEEGFYHHAGREVDINSTVGMRQRSEEKELKNHQ